MKLVVRAAAAAAIAVAALSAAAPAFAATGIAVQVSPSVAKKGATVNVWADCATSGSAEISGQGLDSGSPSGRPSGAGCPAHWKPRTCPSASTASW